MREEEIDFVLQEGEGYRIEFKESVSHIEREMVAFANSSGGKIFIGITDEHKVKGIKVTERLKSQLQNMARNCDPPVKIILETIIYRDKEMLLVEVFEGENKPYSCSEGFYMRTGPTTEKMKRDEIINFFQGEGKIRFDKLIDQRFDFYRDFEREILQNFISRAGIKTDLNTADVLINLGIAEKQEGKIYLNNGGILFFLYFFTKMIQGSFRVHLRLIPLDKKCDREPYPVILFYKFRNNSEIKQ